MVGAVDNQTAPVAVMVRLAVEARATVSAATPLLVLASLVVARTRTVRPTTRGQAAVALVLSAQAALTRWLATAAQAHLTLSKLTPLKHMAVVEVVALTTAVLLEAAALVVVVLEQPAVADRRGLREQPTRAAAGVLPGLPHRAAQQAATAAAVP